MGVPLTVLISGLFVYFAMPLFRRLAIRFRIMDFPGKRKVHKRVTPLIGGVAIYCGLVLALFFNPGTIEKTWVFLSASTAILLLGLGDDAKGLSAKFRLLVQFLASLSVVLFCDRINFLPPSVWGDFIEITISLVWMIGVTNAFNYLDGLDGLAAGSAVINLGCFAFILSRTGQPHLLAISAALAGSCIGFLPHNFRAKKVFLGDAGSTFLGFVLAGIGLLGYWAEGDPVKISIPILILGVPIFDMIFTTVMRIAQKKIGNVSQWLKYAGKDHFHHYLVDLSLTPAGSVVFIYFTTLALGISALMVSNYSLPIMAFLSIFQASIVLGMIGILIVFGKLHHRNGG